MGTLRFLQKFHHVGLAFGALAGLPRAHDALGEGFGAVGQGEIVINGDDAPETATGGTRADGVIETEQGQGTARVFDVAVAQWRRLLKG